VLGALLGLLLQSLLMQVVQLLLVQGTCKRLLIS
jgi:hypothetical protein